MKTTLWIACGMWLASTAVAQSLVPDAATNCPQGRCRPAVVDRWQSLPAPVDNFRPADVQSLISRSVGFCRLRVRESGGAQRLGSAVCVGRGPRPDEWVILSAGHVLADLDCTARIELLLHGTWLPADLLAHNRSPDRAVLSVQTPLTLQSPAVGQSTLVAGRAVMIGYPRGGEPRAFAGRIADARHSLSWLRLERTSHYDCRAVGPLRSTTASRPGRVGCRLRLLWRPVRKGRRCSESWPASCRR